MKVSFHERLGMAFLFPQFSDLLTLDICHEIKEKSKLSIEEMQSVDWKSTGPGMAWFDESKEGPQKDIKLSDAEIYLMQDLLREKVTAKQVPVESRTVCHKIQDLVPKEKRPEVKKPKPK